MKNLELIGGPLDGAQAQDVGQLSEGQNVLVEMDDGVNAVYTLHDQYLEYNLQLTYGK